MTLSSFIEKLEEDGTEHAVLRDICGGGAVFLPAAARLIGLWPDPEGPNLLWTHPDLSAQSGAAAEGWNRLTPGGPGGDRLWYGPECRYFWEGNPQADLSNHRVPPSWDPGNFVMTSDGREVRFACSLALPGGASATIERNFVLETVADPDHLRLHETQRLELHEARADSQLDLWVITQVPAGSRMVVPTCKNAKPVPAYENRSGDVSRLSQPGEDAVIWNFTGKPLLKAYLAVGQVRGILGCLQHGKRDRNSLLLRTFTPRPDQPYLDGLLPDQVDAQCVQFWDGLGYGEIECHSPTATAANPIVEATHHIDARMGSAANMSRIATEALGADPVESFPFS